MHIPMIFSLPWRPPWMFATATWPAAPANSAPAADGRGSERRTPGSGATAPRQPDRSRGRETWGEWEPPYSEP